MKKKKNKNGKNKIRKRRKKLERNYIYIDIPLCVSYCYFHTLVSVVSFCSFFTHQFLKKYCVQHSSETQIVSNLVFKTQNKTKNLYDLFIRLCHIFVPSRFYFFCEACPPIYLCFQ